MTHLHYPPDYKFQHQHLVSIKALSSFDIYAFLDHATLLEEKLDSDSYRPLKNKTLINLFFENSTRTQASFELAGKKLGAHVINMPVESSSVKKGETLLDTAMTLNAMNADLLVMRHSASGAADLLSNKLNCAVINAGDGMNEHPSQALLDAYTIHKALGQVDRKIIVICGDILHSRVARSNILLLNLLGARVRVVAPPTLIPKNIEKMGCEIFTDLKQAIKDADIIMTLRLQRERMQGGFLPSVKEYFTSYGLRRDLIEQYAPQAKIMHPGPVNRDTEITSDLVDDSTISLVQQQICHGVIIRAAILDLIHTARVR